LLVAVGFFEGVEVFSLKILNESQLQHRSIVGLADDDGYFLEAAELGGAPTAFPGDKLEEVAFGPNHERLDDSLFPDGVGKFFQGSFREILAGLEWTGLHPVEANALNRIGARCWGRGWHYLLLC
jgi:hypothetical protein